MPDLGHRQPLSFDGPGADFGLRRRLWQSQLGAAAKLLCAQGCDIDEQESAFNRRGWLSRHPRFLD